MAILNDYPLPVVMPPCTPDRLAAVSPCVDCMSTPELIKFIAFIIYVLQNRGSTDIDQMIDDGKCLKCMTWREMLNAVAALYLALAVENGYVTDLEDAREKARCLRCVDPKIIYAILLRAICDNVESNWEQLL